VASARRRRVLGLRYFERSAARAFREDLGTGTWPALLVKAPLSTEKAELSVKS
jgi:hypothetical protein